MAMRTSVRGQVNPGSQSETMSTMQDIRRTTDRLLEELYRIDERVTPVRWAIAHSRDRLVNDVYRGAGDPALHVMELEGLGDVLERDHPFLSSSDRRESVFERQVIQRYDLFRLALDSGRRTFSRARCWRRQ